MNSEPSSQLKAQIQRILSKEEYGDCFLIDLVLESPKRISVFVDADSGVDFALCQKISRDLESWLDETGIFGTDYVLEVSSPGVDRPLKYLRQYRKHAGRKLKFTLKDGTHYTGRLVGITGDILHVEQEDKRKKTQLDIPFENIDHAIVQISFN